MRGSDIYRTDDSARTVKEKRRAPVLENASSPHPRNPARGDLDGRMRGRRKQFYRGTLSIVGWSDVAYGDQSAEGKYRLGSAIVLTSSTLRCPRHMPKRTSEFTRKSADSSLGGEVYGISEMVDHMSPPREFYEPFADSTPGMAGIEDCGSLFTHLGTNKTVAEGYLAQRSLGSQQSLDINELRTASWLPGTDNPADGLTEANSDTTPLLRLLESGTFRPGALRPLRRASSREGGGARFGFFLRVVAFFHYGYYYNSQSYLRAIFFIYFVVNKDRVFSLRPLHFPLWQNGSWYYPVDAADCRAHSGKDRGK